MPLRFLGKLRNKPKAVRERVALSIAGGVTAVVALAWLFVTPETIGTVATEMRQEPSAFSTLFTQLRDQTAAIGDSFNEARSVVEEEWPDPVATSSPSIATSTAATSSLSITATTTVSSTPATGRTVRIATTSSSGTTTAE